MNVDSGRDSRGAQTAAPASSGEKGARRAPITGEAAARMDRQRVDLSRKVGGAMGEIEQLRLKQRELEQEKEQLQQMAKRQEEYEKGKREMMEKLSRSIVLLEKEREQAVRMVELLGETRERFQEQWQGLEHIREEKWPESRYKEALDSALAQVEAAQTIYRKALARIEAGSWHKSAENAVVPLQKSAAGTGMPRSFWFWLKVGVAVTLPLIAAFGMLTVFLLHRLGYSPAL